MKEAAPKPRESQDSVPAAVARLRVVNNQMPPDYPTDLEAKRREICGGVDPETLLEKDPQKFVEVSTELGRVEAEDKARREAVRRVRDRFIEQSRDLMNQVDGLIGRVQAEIKRLHAAHADAVRGQCERALRSSGFFADEDVPGLVSKMKDMRAETGFQSNWQAGVGTLDREMGPKGVPVLRSELTPAVVLSCWESAMGTLQAVRLHSEELRKAKVLR